MAVALGAVVVGLISRRAPDEASDILRFQIEVPGSGYPMMDLSPDGRTLVQSEAVPGELYVRRLDGWEMTRVPGTENLRPCYADIV